MYRWLFNASVVGEIDYTSVKMGKLGNLALLYTIFEKLFMSLLTGFSIFQQMENQCTTKEMFCTSHYFPHRILAIYSNI